MNKIVLILSLLCVFSACKSQSHNDEFGSFIERFPPVELPLNTANLNNNDNYISIGGKKNKLDNKQCVRYLFNGDKSKVEYKYEKVDMETGLSKGNVKAEYNIYPAFKAVKGDFLLLGFLQTDIYSYSYVLSVYNRGTNKCLGNIEINKMDADDEFKLVQSALIDNDLVVRIFRYEINPEYLEDITQSNIDKTVITETQIQITDSNLITVERKSKRSQCNVADFFMKTEKCRNEDPMKDLFGY